MLARKAQRLGRLFFFTSGTAALIYEVIWLRLLGFVFGNTTYAVSAILTVYMAGLGLGSYWIGRRADRWTRPLRVYGWLELGIGLYASLTFFLLHVIQVLYVSFAQRFDPSPASFTFVRLALSFVILFIPTFFMGATLPILAKFYIHRKETIGSGTALLYGLNTAGAVAGTLLAGFCLLPLCGMRETLKVAVALNLGIGALACLLSKQLHAAGLEGSPLPNPSREEKIPHRRPFHLWLPVGLFISGATAMIYEVGWTRVLATVLGSSTYAFTVMLATFLLGIALGSAGAERILRRRPARWSDWAGLQMMIAFSSMATLTFFDRLGIVTVRLFALTLGYPGWLEAARFGICSALMIVPTFCFGALFPVSAALYTEDPSKVSRGVGTLYLANTLGNIMGSLSTGFLLIPTVGIYQSLRIATATGGLVGLAIAGIEGLHSKRRLATFCVATVVLFSGLWGIRGGWNQRLLTSGLHVKPYVAIGNDSNQIRALLNDWEILFYREGLNSIVSVEQYTHRALRVNGKVDASSGRDMETQLLSSHLPHLLHPNPHRSLVIGFGSGTTLRSCFAHPISKADCAEIESAVLEAAPYFDSVNYRIYKDPRARVIINDGRNHLLTEKGIYDVIVSEPSNPWMAGVASLFTVEFYELVHRRLAPGGIFCQWIQGYALDPRDFSMVIRSVKKTFPHVTLWSSLPVDFLIIASDEPIVFDLDRIQEQINRSPGLQKDLGELGIHGAAGLLASFQLGETDLEEFSKGEELNTDDRLPLEFNAPWAMYKDTEAALHQLLALHRTQPLPFIVTKGPSVSENPDLLVQVGEGHLAKDQLTVARDYFKKALDLNPQCVAAQVGLGRYYLSENQYLKAISIFEEAVALDPKSAYAYGNLGWTRWKAGDAQGALEYLQKAAAIDEQDWDTFFRQGVILGETGRWPEAAEAYQRALKLKPADLQIQIPYAHALIQSQRTEEGIRILEKLRREYRTNISITSELAEAYRKIGDISQAIAIYEELVRLNPYRPENWTQLTTLYNKQGNKQKALQALRRRRSICPF